MVKIVRCDLFHHDGVRWRRDFFGRVVEESFEYGVHFVVEKNNMAAIGKYKPLAVGEVVMDTVDIERAAGGVELAVAEEGGFVGIERLFGGAGDRRDLPAVANLAVDVVDVVAVHEGIEVVRLMQDGLVVIGGLVSAVDGEAHAAGADRIATEDVI